MDLLGTVDKVFSLISSLSRSFELIYLQFMRSCSLHFFHPIPRASDSGQAMLRQVWRDSASHFLASHCFHSAFRLHSSALLAMPSSCMQSSPCQRPVSSPTPRSMLVKKEFSAKLAWRKKIKSCRQVHSIPIPDLSLCQRSKKKIEKESSRKTRPWPPCAWC